MFSTMLADLRDLEMEGFEIYGHVVKASVFCIAGDNLGSHNIGGFTENFSTGNFVCRYCLVTRNDLQDLEDPAPARSVENYNKAVNELKDSDNRDVTGVKFDSVFNSLSYFHVCQPGLPPCIGHDLFEGIVAYDLAVYLTYFVKVQKLFTYTQLNRRI